MVARRKTGHSPFDRKCLNVFCSIFHDFNYPVAYENERISQTSIMFEIKNAGNGYEREQWYLRGSIANIRVRIDIFHKLSFSNIRKRMNFPHFKHLKSKHI